MSKANALKEKGNEQYRKKNFGNAIKLYEGAIAIVPGEITFYSNKAAALIELRKYEDCIKCCNSGIKII